MEKVRRERLSAEVRRKQILDAAYRLIALKGFKSVSTRMIAREAGVNEALIFRYFTTKSGLLRSIVLELKMAGPELVATPPADEAEFFLIVKGFERFFLSFNCADPSLLKIVLYAIFENYSLPDEFNLHSKDTFLAWLLSGIQKGKADWGFDKGVNGVEAVCLFMGSLLYYVLETSVIGTVTPASGNEKFTELFMKTLK